MKRKNINILCFFVAVSFFFVVSCVKMASSEQIKLQVKQTVDEWKLSMGDLLKTNNKLQPILDNLDFSETAIFIRENGSTLTLVRARTNISVDKAKYIGIVSDGPNHYLEGIFFRKI